MPLRLSRVDRVYAHIPIRTELADGTVVVPAEVDVALLPPRTTPTAATAWTTTTYTAYDAPDEDGFTGEVVTLIACPDADPDGALPVPAAGADVFIRIVDNPEEQAVCAGRITIA